MTATESFPALGTAKTMGGAASGEEVSGITTGVARMRFTSLAEMTTQGRRFLISRPTAGSRFTHQTSPRSILIFVQSFPVFHIAIDLAKGVGFSGSLFQRGFFPLQFLGNQIGDKSRTLATGNMGSQPMHERRRQFKSNFHSTEYTIPHTDIASSRALFRFSGQLTNARKTSQREEGRGRKSRNEGFDTNYTNCHEFPKAIFISCQFVKFVSKFDRRFLPWMTFHHFIHSAAQTDFQLSPVAFYRAGTT